MGRHLQALKCTLKGAKKNPKKYEKSLKPRSVVGLARHCRQPNPVNGVKKFVREVLATWRKNRGGHGGPQYPGMWYVRVQSLPGTRESNNN